MGNSIDLLEGPINVYNIKDKLNEIINDINLDNEQQDDANDPASIKIKYESNPDTNAFDDAAQSKLAGIDPGAEVNAVDSVNGLGGAVVLDTGDIAENGNLYYTQNRFDSSFGQKTSADLSQNVADKLTGNEVQGSGVSAIRKLNQAGYDALGDANNIDSLISSKQTLSIGGTELNLRDAIYGNNGLKLYVIGTGDIVYEYDLSEAYDITTGIYSGSNFSVAAQDTDCQGMFFKPDGTKFWIIGTSSGTVHQYSAATPWDVTTASYDTVSKDVNTAGLEAGVYFSPDGKQMLVDSGGLASSFDMVTPYDIAGSTAGPTYDHSSEETVAGGISLSDDGTRMYIIGVQATLFQYTLSVARDISSAVLEGSLDFSNIDIFPLDIYVPSGDGFTMLIAGAESRTVYRIEAPETQWDFIGADISFDYKFVGSQQANPQDVVMSSDGTKAYVTANGTGTISQYNLTTPWKLYTAVFSGNSFSVSAQESQPRGFAINGAVTTQENIPQAVDLSPDGFEMYVMGQGSDSVHRYTLGTAFNVSTAVFINSFSVNSEDAQPQGLRFALDGSSFFMTGNVSDTLYQYTLGTPWDITTASLFGSQYVGNKVRTPTGVSVKADDGLGLFVVGGINNLIFGLVTDPVVETTMYVVTDTPALYMGSTQIV
jgi:sugar lactone lactonase YvrE